MSPITEGEWVSIRALAERVIAATGGGQQILTTKVAKVDPARKVIWVPEFGDQPIPLVDFTGDTRIYDSDVPIGGIIAWAEDDTPPPNYLFCNGAAVSRTEYAELFAEIGTDYGPGDGSTTFNLPPPPATGGNGGGGVDDKHFIHTQSVLSATWTCDAQSRKTSVRHGCRFW